MSGGLVVAGVDVALGGRKIVGEARFTAPRGKITGLVGPNGAGKSTLIGAVVGLHPVKPHALQFGDADLGLMDRRRRARLCAYVEQSAATQERLSVADVVALGRIPHTSLWVSDLGAEDKAIVASALARVGLEDFAARQFSTLSGGEQQRVHIARALAQQPQLLLLDEPTSHLDIRGQLQVLDLLRELAAAGGTVLLALHDLNLALSRCDWLVAMEGGSVVAEGVPTDVLSEDFLARVYGVRAKRITGPDGPVITYSSAL